MFQRLSIKIGSSIAPLFLVAGCAPIGPMVENMYWDCGDATAETTHATCIGLKSNTLGLTYIGPVTPVNYSQALPHGWGDVFGLLGSAKQSIRFRNGLPAETVDWEFSNGQVFSGKIDHNFAAISGKIVSKEFEYEGTFKAEQFPSAKRWANGTVSWKNGEIYKGTYRYTDATGGGENLPSVGTYFFSGERCDQQISLKGKFTGSTSRRLIDRRANFSVKNGAHEVVWSSDDASLRFYTSSKTGFDLVDDPLIDIDDEGNIEQLRSSSPFIKARSGIGTVGTYDVVWKDPLACGSEPEYTKRSIILSDSASRFVIDDSNSPLGKLKDYGFQRPTSPEFPNAGQIFIIKTLGVTTSREILGEEKIPARYVAETYQTRNPAYDVLKLELERLSSELAREQREQDQFEASCTDDIWTCALASSLAYDTASLREKFEAGRRKLISTPTTITERVFADYIVEKVTVAGAKKGNFVVALVDFDEGFTTVAEIPFEEKRSFKVVNSPIAASDPKKDKHLMGVSSEAAIDAWMKLAPRPPADYSKLLTKLALENTRTRTSYARQVLQVKQWGEGRRLSDRSSNEPAARESSLASRILSRFRSSSNSDNYELEDSIVVLSTLDEGMGTGFYVTQTLVVTNAHVVGDANYVSMRRFDGQTATAEVIKKDIGRDLALVEVSLEGRPLKFAEGCQVKRREEVFTIGHPKGYEYSTTRGIVSSLRTMKNPFYSVAGRFQYIQIDAPISSGNSGGPLFNSDERVIGVNTWGRTDGQNLNFAVHCSEITSFIE